MVETTDDDGNEIFKVYYDGYHSDGHLPLDAVSSFTKTVTKEDFWVTVNQPLEILQIGHIQGYGVNIEEVNTSCLQCGTIADDIMCGVTPDDLGLSLPGGMEEGNGSTFFFFSCGDVKKASIQGITLTIQQIIDQNFDENDIPLDVTGNDNCLQYVQPAPAKYAGNKVDRRFNLVGDSSFQAALRTGLEYYTIEGNYQTGVLDAPNSLWTNEALLPPINHKIVREVGKILQNNVPYNTAGVPIPDISISEEDFEKRVRDHYNKTGDYLAFLVGADSWNPFSDWGEYDLTPFSNWFDPDVTALLNQEGPLIDQIIESENRNKIQGTIWEIGNEPNMHIRLDPEDYAEMYVAYHRRIKSNKLGKESKVALGSLILTELLQGTRSRFKNLSATKGEEQFNKEVKDVIIAGQLVTGSSLIGSVTMTSLGGVSIGAAALGAGASALLIADYIGYGVIDYMRFTAKRMSNEAGNQLADATIGVKTYEYLDKILNEIKRIDPEVLAELDILALHAYKFEEGDEFIGSCDLEAELDQAIDNIQMVYEKYTGRKAEIWITEYGNISPPIKDATSEEEAVELARRRMNQMTAYFSNREDIERWFWYKSIGTDAALSQLDLTPNSRLFNNQKVVELFPSDVSEKDPVYFSHFDESAMTILGKNFFERAIKPGYDIITIPLGENPDSYSLTPQSFQDVETIDSVGVGSMEYHWGLNNGIEFISWPRTEGLGAMKFPAGSNLEISTITNSTLYHIGDRMALDVWLPSHPHQTWGNGTINLFISSSDGVTLPNSWLGTIELNGLTQDNFNTVYIDIPSFIKSELENLKNNGLQFDLRMALNTTLDGVILDFLRFQDTEPQSFVNRTLSGEILGFEELSNWSSPEGALLEVGLNKTHGEQSLRVNADQSAPSWFTVWSDVFYGEEERLRLASFVNFDINPKSNQGNIQLSLHCPSNNIHSDWVGSQALSSLIVDDWNRVSIEIPQFIQDNLSVYSEYCRIRFAFSDINERALLDDISFSEFSESSSSNGSNNSNNNSGSSVSLTNNSSILLQSGTHMLKLDISSYQSFNSIGLSVNPQDNKALTGELNNQTLTGWHQSQNITFANCSEIIVPITLTEPRILYFQWLTQ